MIRLRFFALLGGTICAFSFLAYNLYFLQINQGDYYLSRAQAQSGTASILSAERGTIYFVDKNNVKIPAAINKDYHVIFVVPTEAEDIEETAGRIAAISALDLEIEAIRSSLSKPNDQYEELVPRATTEQVKLVREAEIKGLHVGIKRSRFYPFGPLAANVLGFVAEDEESGLLSGQYGIEAYYDIGLRGRPGHFDEKSHVVDSVSGQDVILTIDRNIQSQAEKVLSNLAEKYKPVRGGVIVQDPRTGKILAMANWPSFDPNEYWKAPLENFINSNVQEVYEPGSVNKVLTMVAGIDSGAITPETTYYDTGSLTLDGRTIKNWDLKARGEISMTDVIAHSVNTGAAFAEAQTGHKEFYKYLINFGFKDLAGIDLPAETAGRLTPLEKYPRDINFATASYGHGISVTPLRLITIISGLANKGIMNQPYITDDGRSVESKRIMSEETARDVTQMMTHAVDNAVVAKIPHYNIAGKTGTAFVPDFESGGYTDEVINTYVGFAPATEARFSILIKIEKPENSPLAGQTVVPAFKELAGFILNYYNIAPDRE